MHADWLVGGMLLRAEYNRTGGVKHLQTALVEANFPLPPQALRLYRGQLSEFQQKSILLVLAYSRSTQQ